VLPYLEGTQHHHYHYHYVICYHYHHTGEYWVNEAEVIIKGLKQDAVPIVPEAEGHDEADVVGQKSKRKKKAVVTRAVRNSDPLSQWPHNNERDPVMAKLASIIEPMKEAFFVARLRPKEYAAEKHAQRLQELEAEEEAKKQSPMVEDKEEEVAVPVTSNVADNPDSNSNDNKNTEIEMTNNDSNDAPATDKKNDTTPASSDEGNTDVADNDSVSPKVEENDASNTATSPKGRRGKKGASTATSVVDDGNDTKVNDQSNDNTNENKTDTNTSTSTAIVVKQEDTKAEPSPVLDADTILASIKDDTEDVDDTQDSAFFDTRQTFLNLCQGNHYQFDQLRRVKHTSMMILYHVHNPDAPKFIRNCYNCHNPIIGGVGPSFCCNSCDIHFCYTCIKTIGAKIHNHQLRQVQDASKQVQLTEEQRRERQRSIQLHLQLILHAAYCTTSQCTHKNCNRMKYFLNHEQNCQVKAVKVLLLLLLLLLL